MPSESTGLILPPGSRFHHVGVACRGLDEPQAGLRLLGYEPVGEPFSDPRQGVAGRFLEGPGPRLELLAPLPGSAVLEPWLQGGSRIYHLAYEVGDFEAALRAARDTGARQTSPPTPAAAFDGRRISFFMLRVRLLVELIELA
jgi:methylmalonyl-CoA/ethylmalonyl-CoA epimerase